MYIYNILILYNIIILFFLPGLVNLLIYITCMSCIPGLSQVMADGSPAERRHLTQNGPEYIPKVMLGWMGVDTI